MKHGEKVKCHCGKEGIFDAKCNGLDKDEPTHAFYVYFDVELNRLVCHECWWVLAGVWCG